MVGLGNDQFRMGHAIVAGVALVLAVVAVGLTVGYLSRSSPRPSPGPVADTYLLAWQRGDFPAMDQVSVNTPAGGLAGPLTRVAAELDSHHIHLVPGDVTTSGTTARAQFTAAVTLADGTVWTYQGRLMLTESGGRWLVNWSPAAIFPALRVGERFTLHAVWPARAAVRAADGTILSSREAVAESGTLGLLVGQVAKVSAAQAKKLGPLFRAGVLVGRGGIEQTFQARLAGRPSLTVGIAGGGARTGVTVAHLAGAPGQPVRTTIVTRDQFAASAAVRAAFAAGQRSVEMVAVQPSTGEILAIVEAPGGKDRVLAGLSPPGSTFRVVTSSALVKRGEHPGSTVACPARVSVGGTVFTANGGAALGSTSLLKAFVNSCDTTFAALAAKRLTGTSLAEMARVYGFNSRPALGIPASLGKFTIPRGAGALAADAIGQGTDLVTPLSQAAEVAAVAAGRWRPPLLVTSPRLTQHAKQRQPSGSVLGALRPLTLAAATAAKVGFPAGVHGAAGTAAPAAGSHAQGSAWFIGYRGDLAFAVLVGGGSGNTAAAIASSFLRHL